MVDDTARSFEDDFPPGAHAQGGVTSGQAEAEETPVTTAAKAAARPSRMRFDLADLLFLAGFLAIVVPTLVFIGRETWSSEQGAHGPIILMTGLWLLWSKWPSVRDSVDPPAGWKVAMLVTPLLLLFPLVRITHIVEAEGYLTYAVALAIFYSLVGATVIRKLAFPLIYLAFIFPPPESVIYTMTMPLKVAISESSIWLLQQFGYPIGGTGVMIQIGQYQLLVAAACSGLNSIVTLSALTIFYIYVRHAANFRYAAILLLAVLPVAVAANFIRVIILILLTYHAGEATAQGFLHDLAGLTMFATALALIFLCDLVLQRILARRSTSNAS